MHTDDTFSGWSRAWLYVMAGTIAVFLILPIVIIVPMSFTDAPLLKFPPPSVSLRWYHAFFESERWLEATQTSFLVAFGTVLLATPAGTLAAYGVLTSRTRVADIIWAVIMAPLVVPLVLTAVGLFFTYARLDLNNTMFGLILAHSMHAVPYVFVTVFSALQGFDLNQPRVAQSLGATPLYAFISVTLPQIRLSVIAGAFLAFLSSFDEIVMSLFISGGAFATLPKLMFQELRNSLDPIIASVSSLMLLLALCILALTQFLSSRERRLAPRAA